MRGRYAPSPTGAMHLGNARTGLVAWLSVRRAGGSLALRIEDLDRARVVPGSEERLLDDLRWLGLDWDEGPDLGGPFGPYRQSQRTERYDAAVAKLLADGWAFPCACSRAEVARAVSAPHDEADEGPRYPGTCRGRDPAEVEARAREHGREPAIRFRGGGEVISFEDGIHGRVDPLGPAGVDDFVLRRSDGVAAYQLAVVVDDAAMAVTEVVRGDDLLRSTPRQIALFRALGLVPPGFAHVPLVLSPGGGRLAKRTRPTALGDLRAAGVTAEKVVGTLGASLGLCPAAESARLTDLLQAFELERLPRTAVAISI